MNTKLEHWEFQPTGHRDMDKVPWKQRRYAGLQFIVVNRLDRLGGKLPVVVTIYNDAGELCTALDAHDLRSLREWLNKALDEIGEPRNE